MAEGEMSKYDRLVKSLAAKDRRKGRKGKPRDVKALAAGIGREKYGAARDAGQVISLTSATTAKSSSIRSTTPINASPVAFSTRSTTPSISSRAASPTASGPSPSA